MESTHPFSFELAAVDRWVKYQEKSINRTDYTKALAVFRERYLDDFGGEEALQEASEEKLKQMLERLNLYSEVSVKEVDAIRDALRVSAAARAALAPLVELLVTFRSEQPADREIWTRAIELQRSYCHEVLHLIRAGQPEREGLELAHIVRLTAGGELNSPFTDGIPEGYSSERFEVLSELVENLIQVASVAAKVLAESDPDGAVKVADSDEDCEVFEREDEDQEEFAIPDSREKLSPWITHLVETHYRWRLFDVASEELDPHHVAFLNGLFAPVRDFAQATTTCADLVDSYNKSCSTIEANITQLMRMLIDTHSARIDDAEKRVKESRIPSLTVIQGMHPSSFNRQDPQYAELGFQLCAMPDLILAWEEIGYVVGSLVKGADKVEKIWH